MRWNSDMAPILAQTLRAKDHINPRGENYYYYFVKWT